MSESPVRELSNRLLTALPRSSFPTKATPAEPTMAARKAMYMKMGRRTWHPTEYPSSLGVQLQHLQKHEAWRQQQVMLKGAAAQRIQAAIRGQVARHEVRALHRDDELKPSEEEEELSTVDEVLPEAQS